MTYEQFLHDKTILAPPSGFTLTPDAIHPALYDFQKALVLWALDRGTAAVFADCGLGKTLIQLEWARHIPGNVLIVAPLSVAEQTIAEAKRFLGLAVRYVRTPVDMTGICITNYDIVKAFVGTPLTGMVLDESSILRSVGGATRTLLIDEFQHVPYRLCCTATPAPNDIAEITNHAAFLGIMTREKVLSTFFVHDDNGWRLRGHASASFYRWLTSWAMAIGRPEDMGFDGTQYVLPPLTYHQHTVTTDWRKDGELFAGNLKGITDRASVRKRTVDARVAKAVELIVKDTCESLKVKLQSFLQSGEKLSNSEAINGDVKGESPGVQQSILRKEQGITAPSCESVLSRDKGKSRRREEEEEDRVYAGLGEEKHGAHPILSPRDKRKKKHQTQGTLRTRRESSRRNASEIQGMGEEQPEQTQSNTLTNIRSNDGTIHGVVAETRLEVCDLRVLRYEQSEHISNCGSLPQDWECARDSLFILQSRLGEIQGQSCTAEICPPILGNQWVVWCALNPEQHAICNLLSECGISFVSVEGRLSMDVKESRIKQFLQGEVQVIVSKPSILGRGMNFQCAHTQIFLGLGDSWEDYYQCTRRLWRYGQIYPVDTHIIVSDHETAIVDNVQRKEQEASRMTRQMIQASSAAYQAAQEEVPVPPTLHKGDNWQLWQGDCVESMRQMDANSVDLSVFSPPFMALYQYTGTVRDVGNSKSQRDFFRHFKFVSRELLRVTKPGRICAMHLSQVPAMQVRDGYIGMKDFRGPMIAHMGAQGWIYHGEVVIQKNPQAQAIRIRAKGLAFQQLEKDSAWMRPALADMVLLFRAPGENAAPVTPECTRDEWTIWAHPVWFDIRETHTLNAAEGRAEQDDRHIHPLQLDVIERCIRLWSNRGDLVLDPFAGIGSTGYVALDLGRQSVGCELKASYAQTAIKNYGRALVEASQLSLV